ncbi:MAG: hypothetical protein Q8K60_02185 [Parachlamydiaceae bacterium]|nr:hypothetical protein [Parachlamydiaceae bacterium]
MDDVSINIVQSNCFYCFEPLVVPVQLECGHQFDLDCLIDRIGKFQTCPVDQKPIDLSKIKYFNDDEELKDKYIKINVHSLAGGTFSLHVLPATKIKKLKKNLSFKHGLFNAKTIDSFLQEVFKTSTFFKKYNYVLSDPRDITLIYNSLTTNKLLHSDKTFENIGMEIGKEYKVTCCFRMISCCDYCYETRDNKIMMACHQSNCINLQVQRAGIS